MTERTSTERETTQQAGADAGTGPGTARAQRRPNRRPLWMIIGALLVGAGLLWTATKLDWSWSVTQSPLRGKVINAGEGGVDQPALIPLALLSLAAIAAVLATSGWVRRVVGVLVVLAGLGAIAVAFTELSGVFGTHPNGYPLWQILSGHVLAVLGGVLVVAGGVLVVRTAKSLPRMGANYETPGASKRKRDPDSELWQALSEGDDPTDEA